MNNTSDYTKISRQNKTRIQDETDHRTAQYYLNAEDEFDRWNNQTAASYYDQREFCRNLLHLR